jgi:hypothetical protein
MAERHPSISVYRPVLNLGAPERDYLARRVKTAGIATRGISYGKATKLDIIGKGELLRLSRILDVTLTLNELDELGDAICTSLPASADSRLTVPTRPVCTHTPVDRKDSLLFTVGNSRVIREERESAQSTINDYYDVEEVNDVWFNEPYYSELWIARLNDKRQFNVLQQLLENEVDLLPEYLEFGHVVVEDVD